MDPDFDVYHKWLGIPPSEQPPDHYRLLGTARFESDAEVIGEAADRQIRFVRAQGKGEHRASAMQLLAEITAAKNCLIHEQQRSDYDRGLQSAVPAPLDDVEEIEEVEEVEGLAGSPAVVLPAVGAPKDESARRLIYMGAAGLCGLVVLIVAGVYIFGGGPQEDKPIAAQPGTPNPPPAVSPNDPPERPNPTTHNSPPDDAVAPGDASSDALPELAEFIQQTSNAVRMRKLIYRKTRGRRARHKYSEGGLLDGATIEIPDSGDDAAIAIVAQRYVGAGGTSTTTEPNLRQTGRGTTVQVRAKPGYVVGGVRTAGEEYVEGLQFIFMRPTGRGLDPADQYESSWYGHGERGYITEVVSDGLPVVGLAHSFENGPHLVGLGLVEANLDEIETRLDPSPPRGSHVDSRAILSLQTHLRTWSRDSQPDRFAVSNLVGTPRGSSGWTAPATFYRNDPRIVTGIQFYLQKLGDKTVIRYAASKRSLVGSRAQTTQPLEPLKENKDGIEVQLEAEPGFALGALRVQADPWVTGLQAVYFKLSPDGLDPSVNYASRWIGDPQRPSKVQTLGGDGRVVVALHGSGDEHLTSLGIVQADFADQSDVSPPVATIVPVPHVPTPEDKPENQPSVARQPVPAKDKLAEARKLVSELYDAEIEAASSTADKVALAKNLYDTAIDTRDDPASEYVLYERAAELVAETGQFVNAWRILDKLAERFESDVLEQKEDALSRGARLATQTKHFEVIADHWRQLMEEAIASDAYDLASKAATRGIVAARKAKKPDIVKRIEERKDHIGDARAQFAAADRAKKALADDPNDAAAATQLGLFLCTRKSDWEQGLPLLAKGDDKSLADLASADLASADLAGAADSKAQLKLGDDWWDHAESERDDAVAAFQQRAAFWYRQAVSSLTGLTKARAEKRIAAAGTGGADSQDKWTDLIAEVDVSQDTLAGIWAVKDGAVACAQRGRTITLPDGRRVYAPLTQTLGFPVGVTGSYDLQAQFVFLDDDTIRILFPIGDKSCALSIRRGSSWDLGVMYVTPGGRANEQNNRAVDLVKTLGDGVPVRVDIRVESLDNGEHRVSVALAGTPALVWQGQPTGNSATVTSGGVRTPSQIAVNTYRTAAAFANVRLRVRDGEMTRLR